MKKERGFIRERINQFNYASELARPLGVLRKELIFPIKIIASIFFLLSIYFVLNGDWGFAAITIILALISILYLFFPVIPVTRGTLIGYNKKKKYNKPNWS